MSAMPAFVHALAVLALGCGVAWPAPVGAHGRSISYSTWRIEGRRIDVRARVDLLDLSALAASSSHDDEYIVRSLSAGVGAARCRPAGPVHGSSTPDGWRTVAWTLECPEEGARALRADLLFDVLPSHVHFARVDRVGDAGVERLLNSERRTWELATDGATPGGGESLAGYVMLGVEHIASGFDHVAFLVALLLLARTLGEVALLASSFTVAHSITLALAALGIAQPSARAVEALIGFSIALVAIENVWLLSGRRRFVPAAVTIALLCMAGAAGLGAVALSPLILAGLAIFCASHFSLLEVARDGTRVRAVVAFCFGLAHGFGFAGVLSGILSDPSRLVRGLLGFNAGVELGQLAIVAVLWPLLVLAQRWRGGAPRILVAEVGSAVVCALGTFWFLERSLR
jgi:hypothetical protein